MDHVVAFLGPENWVTPSNLMDSKTIEFIELQELHHAVKRTATQLGAVQFQRSMWNPPSTLEEVVSRQAAVQEMTENPELKEQLFAFLKGFGEIERELFSLMDSDRMHYTFYPRCERMQEAASILLEDALGLPPVSSEYLESLLGKIRALDTSEALSLMKGPLYKILPWGYGGSELAAGARWYTLRMKFRASNLARTPLYLLPAVAVLAVFSPQVALAALAGLAVGEGVCASLKMAFDDSTFIYPLLELMRSEQNFRDAMVAISKLDELAALVKYEGAMPHQMNHPRIVDTPYNYFSGRGIINPVLGLGNPDFVPIDIILPRGVTSLSGPNSSGKTTALKTVAQCTILGLMGSKLAGEIEMSIPDMLRYLYYLPDKLKEKHGDFGVNAQRVNEVFNAATSKSMIFLNALYDGTAPEEVIRHSFEMLQAFNKIGCNTLYVTHNHHVVSSLEKHGFTRCLQTDWAEGRPLFKLKPGIALTSHSDTVLHSLGADLPALEQSLRERGYLKPEESLLAYRE